jgi:hypothetical protein
MKKSKAQEPEIPVLLMQEGTPFVPDTSRSGEYRSHLNEPFRTQEGRILLVREGRAVYTANMRRTPDIVLCRQAASHPEPPVDARERYR